MIGEKCCCIHLIQSGQSFVGIITKEAAKLLERTQLGMTIGRIAIGFHGCILDGCAQIEELLHGRQVKEGTHSHKDCQK